MKSFPNIDPFTYKRKEPFLNPVELIKLKRAQMKFPSIPFKDFKQSYLESKYDIPSDRSLEYMRNQAEQFRSSAESIKPQRKGYEFQILKN